MCQGVCILYLCLNNFVARKSDLISFVMVIQGIEIGTADTPYEMMIGELPGKYHKHFAGRFDL